MVKLYELDVNGFLGYAELSEDEYALVKNDIEGINNFQIDIKLLDGSVVEAGIIDDIKEVSDNSKGYLHELKIGAKFLINETACEDCDLLEWLDMQEKNEFIVKHMEYENNGIWIDGCDYRIDMSEIDIIE